MRVLVFTSSYNRPYMLRQCVLSVKNQSVKDITHAINITSDNPLDALTLINDLVTDDVIITKNSHTHFNNFNIIIRLWCFKVIYHLSLNIWRCYFI
jgi:hypothetical protein